MECRVEYDYSAQEEDELTLKKGDIISNVTQKMDGWWEGTLRGKTGMFPDNFVKVIAIDKPSSSVTPDHISPTKTNSKTNAAPVTLRNNTNKNNRRLKALFSYSPEQDDELRLEVGDVIDFITEVEEGWWRGKLKGKVGIFPSNFVSEAENLTTNTNGKSDARDADPKMNDLSRSNSKVVPPPESAPAPPIPTSDLPAEDEPAPELPPKPVREQARCFYPYQAQNEDELTMVEGEIVTIISKNCEDDGWWRGEIKGRTGLFPDNFVMIIPLNEVLTANKTSTHTSSVLGPKMSPQERNLNGVKPIVPAAITVTPKSDSNENGNIGTGTSVVDGSGSSKVSEEQESVSSRVAKFKQLNFNPMKPTTPTSPGPGGMSPLSLPSMNPRKEKDEEEFNSIERGEKLSHLTAGRAKAPRRRPPSAIMTKDNEENDEMNGNGTHEATHDMSPINHSTPYNLSFNNSMGNNGTPSNSILDGSHASGRNDSSFFSAKDESMTNGNSSNGPAKPKKVLPWMEELKQTQGKKRGLNSTGPTPNTTASPSGISSSLPPSSPIATGVQAKEKEIATPPTVPAKAPPLPAKPSSLATATNNVSADKAPSLSPTTAQSQSANNNAASAPAVANRVFGKKPSWTPATGNVSSNQSNSFGGHDTSSGGGGDTKNYVSYEEHAKLRDRVVILETELETVRRQVKLLIDRELNQGHIV